MFTDADRLIFRTLANSTNGDVPAEIALQLIEQLQDRLGSIASSIGDPDQPLLRPLLEAAASDRVQGEPALLRRDDGHACLYPGVINQIAAGEGVGKSWLVALAISDAIRGGGQVVVLDFEDSAAGVEDRLRALGCTSEQLGLVQYVDMTAVSLTRWAQVIRETTDHGVQLVVLETLGPAMASIGKDENKAMDYYEFQRALLTPLLGGPVLLVTDHLPKDKRAVGAIGTNAKRRAAKGVMLVAKPVSEVQRVRRGHVGRLKLAVHKDTPGWVDQQAAGNRLWSDVEIDLSETGAAVVTLHAPEHTDGDDFRPTFLMQRVSEVAELATAAGESLTTSMVTDSTSPHYVTGKAQYVRQAFRDLIAEGYLVEGDERRGGRPTYVSSKPFRAGEP